jgi:DNA-directed RNA polymerase I, II, and III subunit RPABC2
MSESEEELEEEIEEEVEEEEEEEEEGVEEAQDYTYECDSEDSGDERRDQVCAFDPPNTDAFVETTHSQEKFVNFEEIKAKIAVQRDKDGNVSDGHHQTLPLLTKYELTRVLGVRAKQINDGAPIFVDAKELTDGYLIAMQELYERKIPFILRRPLPTGQHEYWRLSDLELI